MEETLTGETAEADQELHRSERVHSSPDVADRLRRKHPLQYGSRGRDIVYDPGNDPTVGERYNRCPTCEQWSPCDVRVLLEAVHSLEGRIEALEHLTRDYDTYLAEIAPYSYKDGRRARHLREQEEQLGL